MKINPPQSPMLILVANLGSTSFKYKLFDMACDEKVLARGAADRIGLDQSHWSIATDDASREGQAQLPDHGAAIEWHAGQLVELGVINSLDRLDAIGFKAVHGGPICQAVMVDDQVRRTMQQFADVAPAHNPPYLAAMDAFAKKLPDVPQVTAFETAFHQTIPTRRQVYAIPYEWTEQLGVRRYGFHGASHGYIASRMNHVAPEVKKLINCHLGGSSSLCAIAEGKSIATTMGLTPQSGLPQSGRVGDFEIFALLKLNAAGIDTDQVLHRLGKESGLLGISGVSSDMRDIQQAVAQGNERARLAVDVYVESIRHYIGAYLAALGGAEAVCFTGGIGQHDQQVRAAVLEHMEYAGIQLDYEKNQDATGDTDQRIDADGSDVQVWVMPTNEELIVARQCRDVIEQGKQ